ncbi:MAG: uracil-DNA glycosylase [Desulfuromonadales bacterium]|nr:uracil-DNA glycosylase [Desulfuromonadales bacterium]NIR33468.1 uracil-DNA glycosylase [Desulfuromonadales bacterium]NIS43506.1 uracil-DNA glycosylase [Desulfuromonadales bacterium]
MPERSRQELIECLRQAHALLEDFSTLGLENLYLPQIPSSSGAAEGSEAMRPSSVAGAAGESLEDIRRELQDCDRCPLCRERSNIVFGVGNPEAQIVFVGEAPGREEDIKGEPFVGEAGRLLDRILYAMGMNRQQVYICNVEKCRPPKNRDPSTEEIEACEPYLKRQLAVIKPQIIVALGRFAAQTLLKSDAPIGRLRGKWHEYEKIPLMATYHPAFLLRNPAAKREAWEDMKQVTKRLREES